MHTGFYRDTVEPHQASFKGRVGDPGKTVLAGYILKIYKSKAPAPFLRLLSELMPFPFVDVGEDSGHAHGTFN